MHQVLKVPIAHKGGRLPCASAVLHRGQNFPVSAVWGHPIVQGASLRFSCVCVCVSMPSQKQDCCSYFSSLGFGKVHHLVVLGTGRLCLCSCSTSHSFLVTVPLSDELVKALILSSPLCGAFPFKGGRAAAVLSAAFSLAGELAAAAPALASAGGCRVSSEGPSPQACLPLLYCAPALKSSSTGKPHGTGRRPAPPRVPARPSFSS